MSVRRILYNGDPVLRRPCERVVSFDESLEALIEDLKDTLNSTTGVGLAAPQIGDNRQVLIYDAHRTNGDGNYNVLINPTLIGADGPEVTKPEGCKSTPTIWVDIPRASAIEIDSSGEDGATIRRRLEGRDAMVVQHELDHLNGKLIVDRLEPDAQLAAQRRFATFEKVAHTPAQVHNLVDIFERLKPMAAHPQGVVFSQNVGDYQVLVLKAGTQIQLYFAKPSENVNELNMSGIMSRIDIERPLSLLGVYTQAMILSLLWNPEPTRAYMMGFGGGRVPMVLHHHCPNLTIESTETDRVVVSLAKKYFGIALDDRMPVFVREGREHLKDQPAGVRYDAIFVDCFTGAGLHPYSLSTTEFYDLCKAHLTDGGVVVSNLIATDSMFGRKVNTFVNSFKHVWHFENENADVFFGGHRDLSLNDLQHKAEELEKRLGFDFPFAELASYVHPLTPETTKDYGALLSDHRDANLNRDLSRDDPIFRHVGRNDPCPCGSGKKFKKCHGA